jgi:hypothetical protein
VDERLSQFYVCAAQLCADARLAQLTVSMTLAGGERLEGIPAPPPETSDPGQELDETGYAGWVSVGGVDVAFTDVVAVEVSRPAAD